MADPDAREVEAVARELCFLGLGRCEAEVICVKRLRCSGASAWRMGPCIVPAERVILALDKLRIEQK
jgi:hypothetical protein